MIHFQQIWLVYSVGREIAAYELFERNEQNILMIINRLVNKRYQNCCLLMDFFILLIFFRGLSKCELY